MRSPGPLGSCSPLCPLGTLLWVCGVLGHLASCSPVCPLRRFCCVCGVPGHLAPVHRCVRSVCSFACAVSWATWLLFTGAPARCVVLFVRCPGPLGSCSPVRQLGVLLRVSASWAPWLLFTGVPTPCVVLCVRCPGPLGSSSPVRPLGVVCCVCGVLGHLAPVHRCARLVCCFACAASSAPWLLFTAVPTPCVVLRVRCPGPLGSCSPLRPLCPLLCLSGVPGNLAPVHRCARSVCCFACAVSWASILLALSASPHRMGVHLLD